MKETRFLTPGETYSADAVLGMKLKRWISDLKEEAAEARLESFCEAFPEDANVVAYRGNPKHRDALEIHVDALMRGVDLADYFDAVGLTDDQIVRNYLKLTKDESAEVRLRANNAVVRLKHPNRQPVRINARQTNNIDLRGSPPSDRSELIGRILNHRGAGGDVGVRAGSPGRLARARKDTDRPGVPESEVPDDGGLESEAARGDSAGSL